MTFRFGDSCIMEDVVCKQLFRRICDFCIMYRPGFFVSVYFSVRRSLYTQFGRIQLGPVMHRRKSAGYVSQSFTPQSHRDNQPVTDFVGVCCPLSPRLECELLPGRSVSSYPLLAPGWERGWLFANGNGQRASLVAGRRSDSKLFPERVQAKGKRIGFRGKKDAVFDSAPGMRPAVDDGGGFFRGI